MEFFNEFILPLLLAIIGGVISSGLWWLMTRILCFPTFEVSKEIKDYENGRKRIEIKNTSKRYGGYNIECYGEYSFSYNGRPIKYKLPPRSLSYLKAGEGEDINVKIPSNATIDKNSLENAFYQSSNGVLMIRLVYQNKFGIKRSFVSPYPVQKEQYSLQEQQENDNNS